MAHVASRFPKGGNKATKMFGKELRVHLGANSTRMRY
jgi:hypothetical protein